MATPPIAKLKKKDIVWLSTHYCKHRMPYLSHYSCYLKEQPQPVVGFFDIECSDLNADIGVLLAWCIKIKGKDKIIERVATKKELQDSNCIDKKNVEAAVKAIKSCDRIISYYGTGFDLKFIRTRAVVWGIDFPPIGQIYHSDLYYIIRNRFKLHSNRLENACRVLLGKTKKTHFDPMIWLRALQGQTDAMNYIIDHCRKDVIETERLWNKVNKFANETNKSI